MQVVADVRRNDAGRMPILKCQNEEKLGIVLLSQQRHHTPASLRSGKRDLDQNVAIGKTAFAGGARGRFLGGYPAVPDIVHRIEVGDVAQPEGGGQQTRLVGSGRTERLFRFRHDLPRLAVRPDR